MSLNDLSPAALRAAMRGGTVAWGQHGSAEQHVRYCEPQEPSRRRCRCGCRGRITHRGMANGVCLTEGCELRVRRWARVGTTALASASQSARPNDRAHDEPSPTTTPDSLGDVMGGEDEGNTAFGLQPCGEASPDGEVFGHGPQHFDGKEGA